MVQTNQIFAKVLQWLLILHPELLGHQGCQGHLGV